MPRQISTQLATHTHEARARMPGCEKNRARKFFFAPLLLPHWSAFAKHRFSCAAGVLLFPAYGGYPFETEDPD